jgi:hypothetical protein
LSWFAEAIGEIVPQIKHANQVACTNPRQDGYKQVPGAPDQCYPAWEGSFKDCIKNLSCNPTVVKLALGRMVIIGDQIDYIQRVVVDSNVASQEVPAGGASQQVKLQTNLAQNQMQFTTPNIGKFKVGVAATPFMVKVTGTPTPSIKADSLPDGITLIDNKDGTAALGGTPASEGKFSFNISAQNGVGPDAVQAFTLTISH